MIKNIQRADYPTGYFRDGQKYERWDFEYNNEGYFYETVDRLENNKLFPFTAINKIYYKSIPKGYWEHIIVIKEYRPIKSGNSAAKDIEALLKLALLA